MNMRKKGLLLTAFVLLALLVVACSPQEVEVTRVVESVVTRVVTETVVEEGQTVEVTRIVTEEVVVEVPADEEMAEGVVLNLNLGTEPPTYDPALTTDTTSVALVGNSFIALTELALDGSVQPYLATSWESGEDADGNQTWTFTLRDDVQWVKWDPMSNSVAQVLDADGNPTFVKPSDVEFGVKRTIDPATASDYSYVLYILKNAQAVNTGSEEFTIDDVGVVADDEAGTVTFTLENPAPYFPSIASMWIAMPMPADAISEFGDNWTEPGNVVSNGPYVMSEWVHSGHITMVKNPFWIKADEVQIDRIELEMIVEASTAFALYENNELDSVGVPLPEMDRVQADPVLSAEYYNAPTACTYYYGFVNNKYPFDNRDVRAAFVQSIDRQGLIDNVLKGGQIPATSFAPPGIFGAPEPGTVGLPYDPEAARASLQTFLDAEGMTLDEFNALDIVLMYNTSEGHARIAAAIQQMWKDNLGVDVRVENQEWAVYLDTVGNDTPIEEAPHIFRMGWCADYADENNWVHEVFNAQAGANRLRRNCADPVCSEIGLSEYDELTLAGQVEQDPAKRLEIYQQAEKILADDEAAYAPIYHYTTVAVTKPWLQRNYPTISWPDWYNWTVDMDAKTAAMGG